MLMIITKSFFSCSSVLKFLPKLFSPSQAFSQEKRSILGSTLGPSHDNCPFHRNTLAFSDAATSIGEPHPGFYRVAIKSSWSTFRPLQLDLILFTLIVADDLLMQFTCCDAAQSHLARLDAAYLSTALAGISSS